MYALVARRKAPGVSHHTLHVFCIQLRLVQSALEVHALPSEHLVLHFFPPQSTSASSWFLIPSLHETTACGKGAKSECGVHNLEVCSVHCISPCVSWIWQDQHCRGVPKS
jgi:hypothetical protein